MADETPDMSSVTKQFADVFLFRFDVVRELLITKGVVTRDEWDAEEARQREIYGIPRRES